MCVCVCVRACVYACSASSVSGRRVCRWTVQDSGNGEEYADGNGGPVYDVVDNPAAQCGDNRDEGAGPREPRYVQLHRLGHRGP